MALILALAELCMAAGVMYCAFKRFKGQGIGWWVALGLSAIVGGAIGIWLGEFSYRIDPRVLVRGFPVPGAFHVLEHYENGAQQWVDFVCPAPTLIAAANAIFIFSGAIAATTIANVFALRWRRRPAA